MRKRYSPGARVSFGYAVPLTTGVSLKCSIPTDIFGVPGISGAGTNHVGVACEVKVNRVARFSVKQPTGLGSMLHMGLRAASETEPPSGGNIPFMSGPTPAPMTVVSTGTKRFPPDPVGS